jgi:outer membrane protein
VRGAVRAAEKRSEATRLNLRGVEADLFTNVVTAYMDVIRDDAVVVLNTQNVRVLEITLKANRERYEGGDATPTDVAQARGRLSLAQSQLQTAQARLVPAARPISASSARHRSA